MTHQNRRVFLKTLALGTSVMSSGILTAGCMQSPEKKLGVALTGLGYYSTDLLAPALQLTSHCELRGIITGTPSKIPVWQDKYKIPDKNVYSYENMHTISDNEDIDVVYIVLPNSLHAQYSIIAANAGKHVWCEKPMALNAVECNQMIDACNKNKVYLSIGYRMQHEPNTQKIMHWASEKPYGQLQTLSAAAGYNGSYSDHWKLRKSMGGGAMYDMGVYSLNGARYAAGLEPLEVSARYETRRPEIFSEVDETTYFDLTFPNGIRASCSTSMGQNMNKLHVDAANGWYELSPFQAYSGIQGETSDGIRLNDTIPNQQARQMDNDALAILNKSAVRVPGEEGLRDIVIVEAIQESAMNGGKTIKL